MASQNKTYDKQKLLGQVYTPQFIIEKIITDIGLHNANLLGKTLLDPACGDGRFLVYIAQQIIQLSPPTQLKQHLENLHGWDIDAQAIAHCTQNLNDLIAHLPISVNWNIEQRNALQAIHSNTQKFDIIVGNPPYIRIQHLAPNEREFIQQHYQFCQSGSTDIYIAFYELCHFLLSPSGICALITPNTFLYSETARAMRQYFAQRQNLVQISNYGTIQLFENATTYSAITIFDQQKRPAFIYEQAQNSQQFISTHIAFESLEQKKIWQLSATHKPEQQGVALKDICQIHVGITTLCDKAYIFKQLQNIDHEPNCVWINTALQGKIKLEKAILKPIVKASKLKNDSQAIVEYVLFPYEKQQGKHRIIPEEKLKTDYPLAHQYLLSVKNTLDKRDNGKPNSVAWYAFGRSQGLDTSFGKKILFSPMNKQPNFVFLDDETATFYSGYCIKYQGDYQFLLDQLNSTQMADFIAISSRDFRSGWKAYNKRALEEFKISL
jgi:adenine-specific DNA-methyltransferase